MIRQRYAPMLFVTFVVCCLSTWAMAADDSYAVLQLPAVPGTATASRLITASFMPDDVAKACGVAGAADPSEWQVANVASGKIEPLATQIDTAVTPARLAAVLPGGAAPGELRLYFHKRGAPAVPGQLTVEHHGDVLVIRSADYVITHDPGKMGGLPSRIEFVKSGKVFDSFHLNDRVHDKQLGGFLLANDKAPKVELLSSGPLRVTVRVTAKYCTPDQKQPPSQPVAVYTFDYYAGSPVIGVHADIRQQSAFSWGELHLFEINFQDTSFTKYAIGDPVATGTLTACKKVFTGRDWAALLDGNNVLGWLGGGKVYDGRGEYGSYLHGPWIPWSDTTQTLTGSLVVAVANDPTGLMAKLAGRQMQTAALVTSPRLTAAISRMEQRLTATGAQPEAARYDWALWRHMRKMREPGNLSSTLQMVQALGGAWLAGKPVASVDPAFSGKDPQRRLIDNGQVGVELAVMPAGLGLVDIYDFATHRGCLPGHPQTLFRAELRVKPEVTGEIESTDGWRKTQLEVVKDGARLSFNDPTDPAVAGIAAVCSLQLKGTAVDATLDISNSGKTGLAHIDFPTVEVGPLGDTPSDNTLCFPRGPGELQKNVLGTSFSYRSDYPSGGATMQFMALYGGEQGIYVATHDPDASTKVLSGTAASGTDSATLTFDWAAENMYQPGNSFHTDGIAVLQPFRGDWYDAAQIYRQWAETAPWYPRGPRIGQPTPKWFPEISFWILDSGSAAEVVDRDLTIAKFMGVPTALHWYNWHQIPFDNSYPHYFPTKPGFKEGVAKLEAAGIRVMPYINGRLWDSALDDFKSEAIKAATKDEDGSYYVEVYGSKRKLVPMCPTTDLWQTTVRNTVLRLQNEEGVSGVYLDQIAAASPRLCFDKSHGHPLGGGHWWCTQGYWPLLTKLRQQMQPGHFLTSECNAEPYMHLIDGYLTWHWQFQNQVPIFPAVYGGKVVMFGRAYRGGPTEALALRMKAAQQLVFGEELGWINPGELKDEVSADYLRRAARLRYAWKDFLAHGRMLRPPTLQGDIPEVEADWQWSGVWPVKDRSVQTGAWQAGDGRVLLIFANVTDQARNFRVAVPADEYGFPAGRRIKVEIQDENGVRAGASLTPPASGDVSLPPYGIAGWILNR